MNGITKTEITAGVTSVVAKTLNIDEKRVKPKSDFVTDLGADMWGKIRISNGIEARFGVEIPEKELLNMRTVETAVVCIAPFLKQKS